MSIGTNRQPASTMTSAEKYAKAREYEERGLLTLAKAMKDSADRLRRQGR